MTVTTIIDGPLARVTIDSPPVNALGQAVRAGLLRALEETEAAGVAAVILACAGRTFVAGADIREFDAPPEPPHLPDVLAAIEAAHARWIAAIHGTALGGGLELALACACRIADAGARMGLPEVTLGVIPGAGGTVRLPRLVGPETALEMIVGGRPLPAADAFHAGLLDEIAEGNLDSAATALAHRAARAPKPVPLAHRPPVAPGDPAAWRARTDAARARARGQQSILAAVDAVERACTQDASTALEAERAAFLSLRQSPQAAALRHVFFAERSVGRSPRAEGHAPRPLRRIGVVGGGTMGAGIAAACLMAGLDVTVVERDAGAIEHAGLRISDILDGAAKRGKLDAEGRRSAGARLRTGTDFGMLGDADLVIEAVFEDMVVKRAVFERLDGAAPRAVLASNTSYLDVGALAAATAEPARIIGLHFFSPAHVMRLLEVVVPETASGEAVATGLALARRLGKIAVPAGVCDGFIGNRIMAAYRHEADCMIEDGALPHEVDAAMRDFGFPMGLYQVQDLAGLDIAWAMRKRRAATRPVGHRYVAIADRICERGWLGRKAGRGWYDYRSDPAGEVDPSVTAIIEDEAARHGIARRSISAGEIMDRLLRVMQAEGRAVLAEGIADSAEAIDVVMVNGYGFPRWRGGPMFMTGDTA